jgi:ABC-type multidrug transport system fused ATPase/permease subunit
MSANQSANPQPAKGVPDEEKDATAFSTIASLWPYIWPKDRNDLKMRVAGALVILVLAKVLTVCIPFLYKWATDALVSPANAAGDKAGLALIVTVPIMLVVAYGVGRILLNAFNQMRDALFARVSENAIRKLGRRAFVHMHRLSLRFHLQRRTGGLSRTMDHGMKGIDSIVDHIILNTFPTLLEFLLAAVVIAWQFNLTYVAVIAVTIVAYVWFTIVASNWRISIRREMNASDTDANAKAVDSLLNYETVKYFGNENMETDRYDKLAGALRAPRSRPGRRSPGSISARR